MNNRFIIISVGGSLIIPKSGFDISFLKKFKKMIFEEVAQGKRFILVIGGGATARYYQQGAKELGVRAATDLDWIGIQTTRLNAQFVHTLFNDIAYKDILVDPRKRVSTGKSPLLIAAGWKPGASTDYQAVCLAKTYGADRVINLSNIDCVYDKDPKEYPDAKKIIDIDWKTFRKDIVGDVWEPGKNVPFDPIASKTAASLRLTVQIVNGNALAQVKKAIQGNTSVGTYIHP